MPDFEARVLDPDIFLRLSSIFPEKVFSPPMAPTVVDSYYYSRAKFKAPGIPSEYVPVDGALWESLGQVAPRLLLCKRFPEQTWAPH